MTLYPQKPPLTDGEMQALLGKAPLARLGSLNPDGTIHMVALWFGFEHGDLVFGTQAMTNKVRNIRHNPNVTVLVDVEGPPLQGILIYGKATLDDQDVVAKRVAIFEKYMPAEEAQGLATWLAANWAPVIIRVKPERMTSYDYGKDDWIPMVRR
jgi:nitroimidazol reductase NimA-like FMN-containing flavoprotein (pyridoxamine 5'-phosphate oxidase superfamily)